MGRLRRPYQPGGIFHLTARTLRLERRFTPRLRTAALNAVVAALPRSRARLLAVAIMSNHLHLVVQQGERPLSSLMQPLLRRLALILQKAHGVEGPMFWRPYGCRACLDPRHARNAIIYTHLNPVRAGICADPADYPWTSHMLYAERASEAEVPPRLQRIAGVVDAELALPLFATAPGRALGQLREDYVWSVQRRMSVAGEGVRGDEGQGAELDDAELRDSQDPPDASAWWLSPGWGDSLSPLFHEPGAPAPRGWGTSRGPAAPDLGTLARLVLAAEGSQLTPEDLRGRLGGRERSKIRHAVIVRARAAGYRNVEIARYLDVSESAVSKVVCAR